MELKQKLYKECEAILKKRSEVIQNKVNDIQNSLQSETKSTAGDKHETGRAMLQLEREKVGQQLAELQKQMEILQRINPNSKHAKVVLGSVVETTQSNYFISISLGELHCNNKIYYAISSATPIGKLLISKTNNDEIVFRQQKTSILRVL